MKNFTRVLSFVLALVMLFALAACGGKDGGDGEGTTGTTAPSGTSGTGGTNQNEKKTYTVNVKTSGGMAMEGVNVYVYADEAMTDMKNAGGTNEKGSVTFQMTDAKYYVALSGVPEGYSVQPSYTFNGTNLDIVLNSSLIKDGSITSARFEVGDVMYDFSFTDSEGNEVVLSEVLAEKELVVLNYWYTTCSACLSEFPVLNEAYNMFSDKIEILGLNSYALDDASAVAYFESSYGLTLDFPIGKVNNNFNPQRYINPMTNAECAGYPTSVFIDRYGVICAIEVGSMTSLTQWVSVFDHFTGDDYEQKLVVTLDELITRPTPTYPQPSEEEIKEAVQVGEFNVEYSGDAEDVYCWPFIVAEKDGITCLKASNQRIYESYAILYIDVHMEEGQVFAFDYLASSELGADFLHVIVDNEAIYSISGVNEEWKSAYCWVAPVTGQYEIALCYIKDTDTDSGDDTFYVDNFRIVTTDDIDTPSYIPHQAAVQQADGSFNYADIYYNNVDGYYHVGSMNGPLLLANLMGYTQLLPDTYVYYEGLQGKLVYEGQDYLEAVTPFCTVASNSALNGYCTVNYELGEILKVIGKIYGFDEESPEWLKLCKYYNAYGTDGKQLKDPNAGLAFFCAYEAVEGKGYVDENGEGQNFFVYDGRPIMPRGMFARFVPSRSGVYRITANTDYRDGLYGWIFNENGQIIYEYAGAEMDSYEQGGMYGLSMVYHMEAGKAYYIDIALWDVYGVGTVIFDIEYEGSTLDIFTACSVGPFTYDLESGQTIIIGIDAALNPATGYYHEVLRRDFAGNPVEFGSVIYAYFDGPTSLFTQSLRQAIGIGGFDFSKTDYDLEIIAYLNMHNGDVEATDAYLHELWGADYATYAEEYMIEDVFAGFYHGKGADLTDEITAYLNKVIRDPNSDANGCVAVDQRLMELLQMFMDKYTFEGVEDSWQKLCYYYKHLG